MGEASLAEGVTDCRPRRGGENGTPLPPTSHLSLQDPLPVSYLSSETALWLLPAEVKQPEDGCHVGNTPAGKTEHTLGVLPEPFPCVFKTCVSRSTTRGINVLGRAVEVPSSSLPVMRGDLSLPRALEGEIMSHLGTRGK